MALRAALLRHVRVPVQTLTLTPTGGRRWDQPLASSTPLFRWMSSHDDHLSKDEVAERVLSVVKSFPKVDPSKSMALRRKSGDTWILNLKISTHRRYHSAKKKKTDTRDLRPMIKKRIQNRSKDYPVKAMIPLAQQALESRSVLFHGVSSLVNHFPIVVCKFCSEVYVGEEGHLIKSCIGFRRQSRNQPHRWVAGGPTDVLVPVEAFHLQNAFQDIVKHRERFDFDRVPAVVELCLQAGAVPSEAGGSGRTTDNLKSLAETTLAAWESMRSCVERLLLVYPAKACTHCSEVHVGPSGHLSRNCGVFRFQRWRGTHFWRKAGVDDLVPPRIVWRRRPQDPPVLADEARDFYGHAPAVVDLCSKAGAAVPAKYNCVMKLHGLPRPIES